jgi:hypothetical protein
MTLSVHLHLSLTQLFGRVIKASIAIDNGRAAEFIRRRNYFDKSKCYECGVSKPRTLLQYKVFLVLLIFDAHQWGMWGTLGQAQDTGLQMVCLFCHLHLFNRRLCLNLGLS